MHVGYFMLIILSDVNHIENDSSRYDEAGYHMLRVMCQSNAATPEEHIHRNKEL